MTGMHQRIDQPVNSADKRNAFTFFYSGWRDFIQEQPMRTGPFSKLLEKQQYQNGYKAAQRALEDMAGED